MPQLTNELTAILARINAESAEIKRADDSDDEPYISSDDYIVHA